MCRVFRKLASFSRGKLSFTRAKTNWSMQVRSKHMTSNGSEKHEIYGYKKYFSQKRWIRDNIGNPTSLWLFSSRFVFPVSWDGVGGGGRGRGGEGEGRGGGKGGGSKGRMPPGYMGATIHTRLELAPAPGSCRWSRSVLSTPRKISRPMRPKMLSATGNKIRPLGDSSILTALLWKRSTFCAPYKKN